MLDPGKRRAFQLKMVEESKSKFGDSIEDIFIFETIHVVRQITRASSLSTKSSSSPSVKM